MVKRINLNDAESGQKYALVKGVDELRAGDRRVFRGANPVVLGADGKTLQYAGDADELAMNALLARIITEWNIDHPVPKGDVTILDKLDLETIDRLYAGIKDHVEFLNKPTINTSEAGSDPTEGSSN